MSGIKIASSVVAVVTLSAGGLIASAPRAEAACSKEISTSINFTRATGSGCGARARIKKVINGAIVTTDGNAAASGFPSVASDSRGYSYGNHVRWNDGGWGSWKTL